MKATFTLILALFLVATFIGPTSAKRSKTVNYPAKIGINLQASYANRASKQNFFNSNRAKSDVLLKSAQAIKQRLDSIIEEELDSLTGKMSLSTKTEFKYNSSGNIIQEVYSGWDKITAKWIGDWKFETSWNAQGKQYQTIDYEWDAVAKKWKNNYKTETAYNAQGQIATEIHSTWDAPMEKWQNNMKTEYTYNSSGNPTKQTTWLFDDETNQLAIASKLENTYNSAGKLIQDAHFIYNEGEYMQFSKMDYTYNTDGSLKQKVGYTSDFMGGWTMSSRNEFVYNSSGDLTLETSYQSDLMSAELTARWKDEFVFDSQGNMVQEINHEWDNTAKKWFIDSKTEFSFNNSYSYNELLLPYSDLQNYFRHMITGTIGYEEEKGTGKLIVTSKMMAYYSSVNVSGIHEIPEFKLSVFPNPTSDYLTIGLEGINQQILVELFDLKGRKVVSNYLSDADILSVRQLQPGIYICKVNINGQVINTKVVKK